MKVGILVAVGEEQVPALADADADGPVVLDNAVVHALGEGGEERADVIAVLTKFALSVREDDLGGLDRGRPCGNPLSVRLDRLGRFDPAEDEIESISEFLGTTFVVGDAVHAREDVVEVNRLSDEETGPLRIRELGQSWSGVEVCFDKFGIPRDILEDRLGLPEGEG